MAAFVDELLAGEEAEEVESVGGGDDDALRTDSAQGQGGQLLRSAMLLRPVHPSHEDDTDAP